MIDTPCPHLIDLVALSPTDNFSPSGDSNLFEIPSDSSDLGQSKSPFDLSASSGPWTDANLLADSNSMTSAFPDQNLPTFQANDILPGFPIGQADEKIAITPDDFNPFPFPPPVLRELLEPKCPAGKRVYCCSGGKAANNIGQGCSECMIFAVEHLLSCGKRLCADFCPGSIGNWLCYIKYFTLCCKGYVVRSFPVFSKLLR